MALFGDWLGYTSLVEINAENPQIKRHVMTHEAVFAVTCSDIDGGVDRFAKYGVSSMRQTAVT